MALLVRKRDGETWLEAVQRLAEPHGLEIEVTEAFHAARKEGQPEDEAALDAAIEWDVAEVEGLGDDAP